MTLPQKSPFFGVFSVKKGVKNDLFFDPLFDQNMPKSGLNRFQTPSKKGTRKMKKPLFFHVFLHFLKKTCFFKN